VDRIEWIDDTSANLVYSTPAIALKALTAFVPPEAGDVSQYGLLQMIPAKAFPQHPDTRLEVRLAVLSDRKQAGAKDRSRYYLMNPEADPGERRRREGRSGRGDGPRRYRERDDDGYRSQVYDEREQRRREDGVDFDASLYDDDEAALATRAARSVRRSDRRTSSTSSGEFRGQGVRKVRFSGGAGKELFPERVRGNGRLRDRSASPSRDDTDDQTVDVSLESRINRRRNENGSSANRLKAQALKTVLRDSAPRELFPQKLGPNHRRTAAFDAADETADLFANKLEVYDGSSEGRLSRDISSRIASPRLEDRISSTTNGGGLVIKGTARPDLINGISIKGGASVKELFPELSGGNSGKELFSDKLQGRGAQRRRAEDMFH
jgi:hypothetical protein